MVRNDRELLVTLTKELGLDEGDLAHLLGVDPDSRDVQELAKVNKEDKRAERGRDGKRTSRPGSSNKRTGRL
jgi:hypothetical protein